MQQVSVVVVALLLCGVVASARVPIKNPRPDKIRLPGSGEGYGGVFGLDISAQISQVIPQSGWQCLVQQGNYTFAVIQVTKCFVSFVYLFYFY